MGDQTNLGAQPFKIEIFKVNAVKLDCTGKWVVEPLNEGDYSGFPRTGGTYEGGSLSSWESNRQVSNNGNVRSRRVVEVDILECDVAENFVELHATRVSRIDGWNAVYCVIKLRRSTTCTRNGLHFRSDHNQREGTYENS